ncbi:hypothetical protein E2C01_080195 [Portunus trituberculatus]|uniref:Uncharacterized protein n=1 Tax=Portunus trituberculatus TaxID=210409 RepID=A0A5B7IIY7_PORTR|nr:hypothetical protein [Portunus trituberculatus]
MRFTTSTNERITNRESEAPKQLLNTELRSISLCFMKHKHNWLRSVICHYTVSLTPGEDLDTSATVVSSTVWLGAVPLMAGKRSFPLVSLSVALLKKEVLVVSESVRVRGAEGGW